jgi:hypothetical protein
MSEGENEKTRIRLSEFQGECRYVSVQYQSVQHDAEIDVSITSKRLITKIKKGPVGVAMGSYMVSEDVWVTVYPPYLCAIIRDERHYEQMGTFAVGTLMMTLWKRWIEEVSR